MSFSSSIFFYLSLFLVSFFVRLRPCGPSVLSLRHSRSFALSFMGFSVAGICFLFKREDTAIIFSEFSVFAAPFRPVCRSRRAGAKIVRIFLFPRAAAPYYNIYSNCQGFGCAVHLYELVPHMWFVLK